MIRVTTLYLAFTCVLSGCLTSPVYTLKTAPDHQNCVTSLPDKEVLIGLAVSGGGSRAALFAAGAIEALGRLQIGPAHQSMLDQVSHISSVSGGSLASAYYVLKKPSHETPILTATGEMTEGYQQFFDEFKRTMAHDYESPLLWRQIFSLRWFNPAWTAKSLAEILSEEYLGKTKFLEVAQWEQEGHSPSLLINTTLYNDGRRLVLSTLDREALQYNFIKDLPPTSETAPQGTERDRILQFRWDALQSQTPQDLKIDICRVPVAAAVAASMSFPPIIGPISIHSEGEDRYWHIGDGGLSDNTGAESLFMVYLKQLQEKRARRALIILIDSSFPFSVGGTTLNHRKEGFSLFSYDYSRIPSIMEERSVAYRAMFLGIAQRQGLLPDPRTFSLVRLSHTNAQWKDDLSDLPDSCRKQKADWRSPKEVAAHLAGIVTRLWLESTCDRDLILTAAAKVVAQDESKIRQFLEQ